jgi:SOS-response transcriptional repressor LexA
MDIYEARRRLLERLIRTKCDSSNANFSAKTGIAPSYVTRMLKPEGEKSRKKIDTDIAMRIEAALDLEPGSMLHPAALSYSNLEGGVEVVGSVPLVSWVQAGDWSSIMDNFQPGDAEDWLPCPVRHGKHTIALKVKGDSMLAPGERHSYSDGDIIFVDPGRDAKHGDRVVVRLEENTAATFKQLIIEDDRRQLKALNPDWKPRYIEIDSNATMVGVVIGKWVPE